MNEQESNTKDQPAIAKRAHRFSLPMGALGMDLDHSGELAFVACLDGVYQLHLDSGKFDRLYEHDSYASNVVFVPDNNQIVSAGYDGALQWFDLQARKIVHRVRAHSFWSWDMAKAKSAPVIASSSGQYLAGSYDYRPQPTDEPTVKVYDALSGLQLHEFEHLPPVQAVAVSDDGSLVGAGNLMGDVGVWNLANEQRSSWNTPDFTGFGIIKSHCQIGGIYAATFASNNELIVAGMGPMRDPMAGNGKQRWQCFSLNDVESVAPKPKTTSKDDQVGEGLMETLAFHPNGRHFAMGGRLRGGSWNVGLFDLQTSDLVHSFKTETRVTKAVFSHDGTRLFVASADKQHKDTKKEFGVVDVYEVNLPTA